MLRSCKRQCDEIVLLYRLIALAGDLLSEGAEENIWS